MLPSFSTPASWASKQHLHEQLLEFGQKGPAKGGQRVVVGMQIAGDEAKGHRLIGGPLDLARTEHAGGIAIEQQAQQHFGGIGLATARPIAGIKAERSSWATLSTTKRARWSGGRQSPRRTRQIERLVIVHGFEMVSSCSHSIPCTATGHLLLSDKLLEEADHLLVQYINSIPDNFLIPISFSDQTDTAVADLLQKRATRLGN